LGRFRFRVARPGDVVVLAGSGGVGSGGQRSLLGRAQTGGGSVPLRRCAAAVGALAAPAPARPGRAVRLAGLSHRASGHRAKMSPKNGHGRGEDLGRPASAARARLTDRPGRRIFRGPGQVTLTLAAAALVEMRLQNTGSTKA